MGAPHLQAKSDSLSHPSFVSASLWSQMPPRCVGVFEARIIHWLSTVASCRIGTIAVEDMWRSCGKLQAVNN